MALSEGKYLGDWLLNEFGAPEHCRIEVTVVSGQKLVSGAVVGKITVGGKYAAYDNTANTGIEAAAGVLLQDVDASTADKKGVIIVRGPVTVKKPGLTWHANNDAAAITAGIADLAALDFVFVEGV